MKAKGNQLTGLGVIVPNCVFDLKYVLMLNKISYICAAILN
jgi:hypothetical protein